MASESIVKTRAAIDLRKNPTLHFFKIHFQNKKIEKRIKLNPTIKKNSFQLIMKKIIAKFHRYLLLMHQNFILCSNG